MGCQFQVLCTAAGRQSLATAVTGAFARIHELEQQLSIYRDTSELAAINRQAARSRVHVEAGLFELLRLSHRISLLSDGAFDITATPVSRLWKAHRQQRTLPDQDSIQQTLTQVGFQRLQLDETDLSVGFDQAGCVIDLGGIGKGYAIDCMREWLQSCGCQDFLIHGGQSSVMACGQRDNQAETSRHPWEIALAHPLNPTERLARLRLDNQAIGTSGSGRQYHIIAGRRYGHIIDPRTGWPADHFLSVTVLADTAVLADALATAIFVAGPDQAAGICERFGVSAVLVADHKNELLITTVNLPDERITLETG